MRILALLLIVGMVAVLAILIALRLQNGGPSALRFARRRVLTAPQQVLHHRLRLALTPQYQLLAQVSFDAFIAPERGAPLEPFGLARARHGIADFLVCDHAFNPLCVIELDDGHGLPRDRAQDEVIRAAGIGLLRYNVQAMPKPEQIRSDFSRTRALNARMEIYGGSASDATSSGAAPV